MHALNACHTATLLCVSPSKSARARIYACACDTVKVCRTNSVASVQSFIYAFSVVRSSSPYKENVLTLSAVVAGKRKNVWLAYDL